MMVYFLIHNVFYSCFLENKAFDVLSPGEKVN